ncbi:MAG: AMP-binding protein, partial [Bythopirellula sp.]
MQQLPLIEHAGKHGDAIAVRDRGKSYAYDQLVAQSKRIARELLSHQDDLDEARIAYLVPAGFDYIVVQWAIWQAGGIAVPLSLSATETELEYTLSDSQSKRVLVVRELASKLAQLCDRLGTQLSILEEITEEIDKEFAGEIDKVATKTLPEICPSRRAMILYTSGTTSKPKGVVTTHVNIQAQIETLVQAWHWQAGDCIPLFLPLHHIHGIINVMSCALWSGATIEAFPQFQVEPILQRVAARAYTVFMAVPTIYVKLIQALEAATDNQDREIVQGFAEMRLMVSGSAALPASVHQRWTELTGQNLLERYGMTEIGMALS